MLIDVRWLQFMFDHWHHQPARRTRHIHGNASR